MTDLEFHHVDRFTTGTVGPPGQRVFYIQAVESGHVVTFKIEKQQVTALADSLHGILSDLPTPDLAGEDLDLVEPVVAEWAVGALGIAYDDQTDRILLVAEQFVGGEDDADGEPPDALGNASTGAASARFQITRDQAAAFVNHARGVVAAGRPPCLFCGLPRHAAGHVCPRMN